jgi:hypothetical protein
MTLLAMLTAAPRSSLGLLEALAECKEDEVLEVFEKQVSQIADISERQYATAALATYRKGCGDVPITVKELQTWAPQVARFSFRSARS